MRAASLARAGGAGGAGAPVRFLLVGAAAAVLDYGCYRLAGSLGLGVSLAKAVGFVAGTTAAYLLNRAWTFGASDRGGRLGAFLLLYAGTLLLNVGVNALALELLDGRPLAREVAFVVAQALTSLANYLGLRHVVFPHGTAPASQVTPGAGARTPRPDGSATAPHARRTRAAR